MSRTVLLAPSSGPKFRRMGLARAYVFTFRLERPLVLVGLRYKGLGRRPHGILFAGPDRRMRLMEPIESRRRYRVSEVFGLFIVGALEAGTWYVGIEPPWKGLAPPWKKDPPAGWTIAIEGRAAEGPDAG